MRKAVEMMPMHYLLIAMPLFNQTLPCEPYVLRNDDMFDAREAFYSAVLDCMKNVGGHDAALRLQKELSGVEKQCKTFTNQNILQLIRQVINDDNVNEALRSQARTTQFVSMLEQSYQFLNRAKIPAAWDDIKATSGTVSDLDDGDAAAIIFSYSNMSHAFDAKHLIAVVHFLGDNVQPEKWRQDELVKADSFREDLTEILDLAVKVRAGRDGTRLDVLSFQWYMRWYLIAAVCIIIQNETIEFSIEDIKHTAGRLKEARDVEQAERSKVHDSNIVVPVVVAVDKDKKLKMGIEEIARKLHEHKRTNCLSEVELLELFQQLDTLKNAITNAA